MQFLLGLHHRWFAPALAVVAVAEPIMLASAHDLEAFAAAVLAVQAVGAALMLVVAGTTRTLLVARPA